MKLFSEKVTPTFTNSSFNILRVEKFSEIFFDVYEIELNKVKYPVEKISTHNGNPVVSVPVVIGENEQNYPFVLIKGDEYILFNENNIEAPIDNTPIPVDDTDMLFEKIDIDHDHHIKEETKREIMEHIETAKSNARKQAEAIKREKIKEADTEIRKKNKLLKESLNTAKQQLVNEFISITKTIKRELISDADDKYSELTITIDNKINDLADHLAESIQSDFENSSKEFETNIKAFVKAIHNESVLPELRKSLENIATDAVVRIKGIESDLDKKLTEKVDVSVIQDLTSELDALRNTNIELNNTLNKGVNKALSRVGNVNNRLDEAVADISKQVDDKISATAENISSYYSDKLKVLEDQTFELNEKSRQYVVGLVRESRDNLISEIRKIQKEAPVEFVIESTGKKKTKSFDSIEKDIDKKISDKVADEVVKLRKYIAVYSSGGGSVAQQFANGGTMNGNLTVMGAISASSYIGIPNPDLTQYLPISGGTVNGNLTVTGTLSTTLLDALSANITVIDIKQYELSGFNVQGNATVQGSISATGNISSSSGIVVDNNRSISVRDVGGTPRSVAYMSPFNTLHIGTGATGFLLIQPTQNVAIGVPTGNPASKLAVHGNASIGTPYTTTAAPTNGLIVAGNVGIGTATPNERLTVSGNISATGNANITGNLTVNTNTLFADSVNNRVGIGNASPTSRLDVVDNAAGTSAVATISGAASTGTILRVVGSAGSGGSIFTALNTSSGGLRITETGALFHNQSVVLNRSGGSLMSLGGQNNNNTFNSNNFGSHGATDFVFQGGTADRTAGNLLQLRNFTVPVLTVTASTSAGNVGIGTSTPNERLTIAGNISASGNLSASNIFSNSKPVIVSEDISEIAQVTQSEYDSLTPNPSTFYIITDADQYGPVSFPIKAVNGNYVITEQDYTLKVTVAASLSLPTSIGAGGRIYNIKNWSTGTVSISAAAGEYIDNFSVLTSNTQYESFTIQSDGVGWIIL